MKPADLSHPSEDGPLDPPRVEDARSGLAGMPEVERRALLDGISPRRQAFDRVVTGAVGGILRWIAQQWLVLLNMVLGLIVGGAFLVPILYYFGMPDLGQQLFMAYHTICEQIPSHSYFLLGYQLGLCARNLAIYSSFLIGSLAFHALRRWLPPLDWRLWLLLLVPMALDGGAQLVGWRESTWELRTLTGVLFGLACCWFVLPRLEQMMCDRSSSEQASMSGNTAVPSALPTGGLA